MYNAYGSRDGRGSTWLHMDLTDAANIMHWAAPLDDKPGYAVWDVFPADSTPLLRKFLTEAVGFEGPGDPIHSQGFFLTPELLDRLQASYGVKPYTIHQYAGQVVFIPAGCPHQVILLSNPPVLYSSCLRTSRSTTCLTPLKSLSTSYHLTICGGLGRSFPNYACIVC